MAKAGSKLTRRTFVIAGSAAAATPLLVDLAASRAEAATAETAPKIPKGMKVYYINDGCIGCQVCRTYCPTKAIRFGNCKNEIDQSKCIHCGTCYRMCHISVISEVIQSSHGGVESTADTIGSVVGVATVAGVAAHAIITHIHKSV
jgi:ferredoxin